MAVSKQLPPGIQKKASGQEGLQPKKPMTHKDFMNKKEESRRSRRPFEREWYLNVAYLNGEQFVEYSVATSRLIQVVPPEGATRTVRNVMFKIARNERAKMLKVLPEPEALPRSVDQSDIMDARVANAYFKYLADQWKFNRRLRNASYWTIATGNAFLKWYWDPGTGECCMAVVPPFDIFPDPYAHTFQDCEWLIHQQFMSVERAQKMFANVEGADVSFIKASNSDAISPMEARLFVAMGDGVANLKGTVLSEYWQPPSAGDNGRHVVFTSQGIVLDEDFPYVHGRMPFTHIGHIERANSKWYSSVCDVLRPGQQELNRSEAQLIENRNLSNGKWFISAGLELTSLPNAEPRQILMAREGSPPNAAPQLISPNTIPQWVHDEPERIQGWMEDIAGQHEVSNAGVPGRVESAQAVQLLQETDDSVMKDTTESMNEAIADGFWMCMQNWIQYGDVKKMVTIYDKQGLVEVMDMKRDNMKLEMRIQCKATTALPATTAGKWDRVLNLFQYKIIDGPTALNLLGLTPEEPDVDPTVVDRKKAYRENQMMKACDPDAPDFQPPRPDISDNHGAHREEHDKFRKTAEYEAIIKANPKIKGVFDFHDYEHEMWDVTNQVRTGTKQALANAAAQQPAPLLPPPLDPPAMPLPPPPQQPPGPPGQPGPPPGPPGPPPGPPGGPPPGQPPGPPPGQ